MATIIPFPANTQTSLTGSLASVRATLTKGGLTPKQIDRTIEELRPVLEPLFEPKSFAFEVPASLGLTPDQIAGIEAAYQAAVDQLFAIYGENIGYAVAVIAGLTAREQSNE